METKMVSFTAAQVAAALPIDLYLHIKDRVTLPNQFFVVQVVKSAGVYDLAWSIKQYSANGTIIKLHDVLVDGNTVKIVVVPNTRFGQAGIAYAVLSGLGYLASIKYTLVNAFERVDDQGVSFKGLKPEALAAEVGEPVSLDTANTGATTQGDGSVSEAIWNTERLLKVAVIGAALLFGLYMIYKASN